MVEIYRIEKGAETWKYKAYDYVRTDAFCVGQSIPIELEFSHDEKEEDLQAVILIEDHKPVAGCRIAFPRREDRQDRTCLRRPGKTKRRLRQNPDPGSRELVKRVRSKPHRDQQPGPCCWFL